MVDVLGQDGWSWNNVGWSMAEDVGESATEKSGENNLNKANEQLYQNGQKLANFK